MTPQTVLPQTAEVDPNQVPPLYLRVFTSQLDSMNASPYQLLHDNLPLAVLLNQKFTDDFIGEPEIFLGEYQCPNKRLGSIERGSYCTFEQANWQTKYACDRCILHRSLCIRPVKLKGKTELAIHPLPEELRERAV